MVLDHIGGFRYKKLISVSSEEIIDFASKAIGILTPIQNFPGISRAYQARATAFQNIGDHEKAEEDLYQSQTQKV